MTIDTVRRWKPRALRLGSALSLAFIAWAMLTAALGESMELPGWFTMLLAGALGWLVVWGSTKTKVERLEEDMKDRVTQKELLLTIQRLEMLATQAKEAQEALCERLDRWEHDNLEPRRRS